MFLEELPLLDAGTSTEATHYETGNWTKMSWAGASMTAGVLGFRPASFSTQAGSYWSAASFTRGAATIKYVSGSMVTERYLGLWVDMAPASHNGYRCKFLNIGAESSNEWKAIIYKVAAGVETVLVESAAHTVLIGSLLGFWDNNGTLEAWYHPEGGAWTLATSHADATYTTGNIGIDGSGSNPSLTEWRGASSPSGKVLNMVV
jgi:hypothetical protein